MTQNLTTQLNSFDYYYNMSDSNARFETWSPIEKQILKDLSLLSVSQLIQLKSQVTVSDKSLYYHFGQYFEGLPTNETKMSEERRSELSDIMTNAWSMIRSGVCKTISTALRLAWKRSKLLSRPRSGIAYFSYQKDKGAIRNAIGTLRTGNFSYQYKSDKRTQKPEVVKYFDVEKRAWRSCRIDRLQTV